MNAQPTPTPAKTPTRAGRAPRRGDRPNKRTPPAVPLADITSLDGYLTRFAPLLTQRLVETHPPLYDPQTESPHPRLLSLLRTPYRAQADTITALARALAHHRGLFLVGELGTGKTLMAAGVMHALFAGPFRALVMCPGHLVGKWRREILKTLPRVTVETIRTLADCLRLERRSPQRTRREVWLVSRDRAKLSFAWTPALLSRARCSVYYCPRCMAPQVDRHDSPLPLESFERSKRKCVTCQEPLWQANRSGPRRYAPAEFIGRRLGGWFDLFVADETHELKGASTAQGNALGRLAAAARRTLTLTGTLAGGYASNLQRLIARIGIDSLLGEGLQPPGYPWHPIEAPNRRSAPPYSKNLLAAFRCLAAPEREARARSPRRFRQSSGPHRSKGRSAAGAPRAKPPLLAQKLASWAGRIRGDHWSRSLPSLRVIIQLPPLPR